MSQNTKQSFKMFMIFYGGLAYDRAGSVAEAKMKAAQCAEWLKINRLPGPVEVVEYTPEREWSFEKGEQLSVSLGLGPPLKLIKKISRKFRSWLEGGS